MISVILATKNRPESILATIKSILNNNFDDYELIIVDQSDNPKTEQVIRSLKSNNIIYIHQSLSGKSNALNKAIRVANGNIFAFTDDDCIVNKSWLHAIKKSFANYPNVVGVFGRSLPYKSKKNRGLICPSTFDGGSEHIVKRPSKHWLHIGFGNNMAFRKSFFTDNGLFKTYLGPGTMGVAAEDAEIALRGLIKKATFLYSPHIVIYHNKWLTKTDSEKLKLRYMCGEMACYGYFYFQGYKFARSVVKNNVFDSFYKLKNLVKKALLIKEINKRSFELGKVTTEIVVRIRGLLIAGFYAIVDPIQTT